MADGEVRVGSEQPMRLDRFLWFARIAKSRAYAQAMAGQGHFRIDGRPIARAAAPVRVGNVLTFATHRGDIRAIRIERLPARRGPPAEARLCYADLTDENVSQKGAID